MIEALTPTEMFRKIFHHFCHITGGVGDNKGNFANNIPFFTLLFNLMANCFTSMRLVKWSTSKTEANAFPIADIIH